MLIPYKNPTVLSIQGILDSYDEFGAVLPTDSDLPGLAERVHHALGELVHFQDAVGKWGEETFPHMTNASIIAHRESIDLLSEARRKQAVNQQRTWGAPNDQGICRHVDQNGAE